MALNIENIVAELENATILELSELVKAIEEKFDVTAAAPVAAAAPSQAPPMPAAETFAPATNFNEEEADDLPF